MMLDLGVPQGLAFGPLVFMVALDNGCKCVSVILGVSLTNSHFSIDLEFPLCMFMTAQGRGFLHRWRNGGAWSR